MGALTQSTRPTSVSGTGIPRVGPCDCQGSITICPVFDLALDNVVMEPQVWANGARDGAIQRDRFFTVVCVRRRSARNTQATALSRPVSGAGGVSANACGDLVVALPGGCS